MIPYDEQKSIDFGLGINAVNEEYKQIHGIDIPYDPGMISVMSQRASWDYYVGGLSWNNSKTKHLNEYRDVYGLPHQNPNPAPGNLKNLIAQGQFFALENNDRISLMGCSDFNLLNRYQHEGEAAIRDVLQQRKDIGFNILRVWTAYENIPNIGDYRDIDYSLIPKFVELAASYGLYIEFTAYTGWNDINHWDNLITAALQCEIRPLLELVNELDQNLNEPDSLGRVMLDNPVRIIANGNSYEPQIALAPLLSCHGSNGSEHQPVEPLWDYATMHYNDAFEEQRKWGHNSMEVGNIPVYANETSRAPTNGIWNKSNAHQLGFDSAKASKLLCGGWLFHSENGKISQLLTAEEESLARSCISGCNDINIECQAGPYKRLEPEGYLRRYERPVDGLNCLVEISK